eukprot:jgi/Psemu1/51570/gm1.51570_g
MTQTVVSWNEVRGIQFSFGPNFTAGNRQSDLNAVFSRILPNIASLFLVDDDGVETLRPDPIPVLKSIYSGQRKIILRFGQCPGGWHSKAIGGRMRVRDNQVLDIAAHRAQRGHPIINLVLHTMHWKFHKDWYPYEFHKVYTTTTGIPSDETGLSVKPPSRSRLHRTKPTAHVVSETLPVPFHPTIGPSGTTALVHTKPTVSNPIKTPSKSTTPNASRYTWTWIYSPNSESVSFRRVPSDAISFHRASSPSPPVQRQDKSPVTALSITPSALTRPEPSNFQWTFHPQSETVVFHRPPKPASVPLTPSLRLPLPKTAHKNSVLASATSTFTYHSAYLCHFRHVTCSNPNQTVVCLTKRHRDALKIKLYHLRSNGVYTPSSFYNHGGLLERLFDIQSYTFLDRRCVPSDAALDLTDLESCPRVSSIAGTLAFQSTTPSDDTRSYVPFFPFRFRLTDFLLAVPHDPTVHHGAPFTTMLFNRTSTITPGVSSPFSILADVFRSGSGGVYPHDALQPSPLLVNQGVYVLRPKASPYNPQPWDLIIIASTGPKGNVPSAQAFPSTYTLYPYRDKYELILRVGF